MKHIINIKGEKDSGNAIVLRDFLPLEFGLEVATRCFLLGEKFIRITSTSIHEDPQWVDEIKAIVETKYDIYILPLWIDEHIGLSEYVPIKIERVLNKLVPGEFRYYEIFSEKRRDFEVNEANYRHCSKAIKNIVDGIVFGQIV